MVTVETISRESVEKLGRNVHIDIEVLRHGEKESSEADAHLTEEGKEKIKQFAERHTQQEYDAIKSYYAGFGEAGFKKSAGKHFPDFRDTVPRVLETAEEINAQIKASGGGVLTLRARSLLGYFFREKKEADAPEPENLEAAHALYAIMTPNDLKKLLHIEKMFTDKLDKNAPPEEVMHARREGEREALRWFLESGDTELEPGSLNRHQIAARISEVLTKQINMGKKLYADSRVKLFDISQSGLIESFLYELLAQRIAKDPINPDGKDFIDQIGGPMNFLEGFALQSVYDTEGNLSLQVSLSRGGITKTYPIEYRELLNRPVVF